MATSGLIRAKKCYSLVNMLAPYIYIHVHIYALFTDNTITVCVYI